MKAEDEIPTLTDLIEKGSPDDEIRLADLGLDDADTGLGEVDLEIEAFPSHRPGASAGADPVLERTVRRIFDRNMELAWQEIRLAIRKELDKS